MWKYFCLISLIFTLVEHSSGSKWNYENQYHWHPTCENGKRQSPINFDESEASERHFSKFVFELYNTEFIGIIKYNGHNIILQLNDSDIRPKIHGGGLTKEYVFQHLHFHWKSEHTLNGYRFPLEVHLVHFASDYETFEKALNYSDGISVLGVFYDVSPDDDVQTQPFIQAVERVQKSAKLSTVLERVQLSSFLPRDIAGFFRYNGSLTTPNCTESVIWTMFSNTLPISEKQVIFFQSMNSAWDSDKQNYRTLQDLNGRKVFKKISPIHNIGRCTHDFTLITECILLFVIIISNIFIH